MKKYKFYFLLFLAAAICFFTTFSFASKLKDQDVTSDMQTEEVTKTESIVTSANSSAAIFPENQAKKSGTAKIIPSDPQKPIVVQKRSPVFSLILQSNPTTGYSWALKSYDSEIIKPVGKKFYSGKTTLVGAPGYEKWTFMLKPNGFVVPQTTNITLIYSRPWDLQGAQAVNFKLVTSNAN